MSLCPLRRTLVALVLCASACSLIVDVDRPLPPIDGGPRPCDSDEDCDDGLACTELRCLDGSCLMVEGGDSRDLDGDGFTSSSCGGPDCNDDDLQISPDAEERCNGVDDDCDGSADEGVWGAMPRASLALASCIEPEAARSPGSIGVVCEVEEELCSELGPGVSRCLAFFRLSFDGVSLGQSAIAPILTTGAADPAIAYSDGEDGFGIVWADRRQIWFAFVSAAGSYTPGNEFQVTANEVEESSSPAVDWNGSRFVVAWVDIDQLGGALGSIGVSWLIHSATETALEGEPLLSTFEGVYRHLVVIAGPSVALLAWTEELEGDRSSLAMARANQSRMVRVVPPFGGEAARRPDLLWLDEGRAAVAYRDKPEQANAGEIFFATLALEEADVSFGEPLRLTDMAGESDEPCLARLAAPGAEIGVAWHDERASERQVLAARVDLEGRLLATDLAVSREGAPSDHVSLVATGSSTFTAVYHSLEGSEVVITSTLGCFDL